MLLDKQFVKEVVHLLEADKGHVEFELTAVEALFIFASTRTFPLCQLSWLIHCCSCGGSGAAEATGARPVAGDREAWRPFQRAGTEADARAGYRITSVALLIWCCWTFQNGQ